MKPDRLLYYLLSALLLWAWMPQVVTAQSTFPALSCDSESISDILIKRNIFQKSAFSLDTVRIRIVADHALFKKYHQSLSSTEDYIKQVFQRVQAIYAFDDIHIALSHITVWTTPDPYILTTANTALASFRSTTPLDEAYDIQHLLSASDHNHGGTAYLNGLCNREYAYGYSNVMGNIDTTAEYNWDVHVLAHELGHSLGSPHTNICVWGPDGKVAIDGCAQVDPTCNDADIPILGGSVMSSCHLYPTGIRLDAGMGTEPANVIKETILTCGRSVGSICDKSIEVNAGIYVIPTLVGGFGAQQNDATHSRWYSFTAYDRQILQIGSCQSPADTRLFVYQGDCDHLELIDSSDDDCISTDGHYYASYIDSIFIEAGQTIFIEWDDRWSSEGFTFFINSSTTVSCTDGIKNGTEIQIDCGGECPACDLPCSEPTPLLSLIDNTFIYRTYDTLLIDSEIIAPANVELSSAISIEIQSNFKIVSGAEVSLSISPCHDETPNLKNE